MFMRKQWSFVLAGLLFVSIVSFSIAQNAKEKAFSYEKIWKQVEHLDGESLPKSATKEIDKIRVHALKEKNNQQLIKTMIYQLKMNFSISDDTFFTEVDKMDNYAKNCDDKVAQSVLYSLLSELYEMYYNAHLYVINARTQIADFTPKDRKEWTSNHFLKTMADYARMSLQNARELQNTPVSTYQELLEKGDDTSLRPTMFDLLAHRTIDFYQNQQNNIGKVIAQEEIDPSICFAPSKEFLQHAFSENIFQVKDNIARIYQQLLSFHQKNNADVFCQADIDRLMTFHALFGQNKSNNDLYMSGLDDAIVTYASNPLSLRAVYLKAEYFRNNDNKKSAYDLCVSGIQKFPHYKGIGVLRNMMAEIATPSVSASNNELLYPKKSLEIKLKYNNVERLILRLFKVNMSVSEYENAKQQGTIDKRNRTLVQTETFNVKKSPTFSEQDTCVFINVSEEGIYEYQIGIEDTAKEVICNNFFVTRLMLLQRLVNENTEFYVLDRMTGQPLNGATVQLYRNDYRVNRYVNTKIKSYSTDKKGFFIAQLKDKNNYKVSVSLGNDEFYPLSYVQTSWYNPNKKEDETNHVISLFTDRALYRPTQTVHFKGIAWASNEKETVVEANKNVHVVLRNSNNEVVNEKDFQTNEFGSFAGEFILPKGLLNGYFTIQAEDYSLQFLVEEYKRPTFFVEFDDVQQAISFGDTVKIKGKVETFMGFPLQSITAQYRIVRQSNIWLRFPIANNEQLASGNVLIDEKGNFSIPFVPKATENERVASYQVYIDVTDNSGETQQGTTHFVVGEKPLFITTSLPDKWNKNELQKITVSVKNINGKDVVTKGTYEICSLYEQPNINQPVDTSVIKSKVLQGNFSSEEPFALEGINKLYSGTYKAVFRIYDDKKREVVYSKVFILYAEKDKKPPLKTYNWFLPVKTECEEGENAKVILGTSANDVNVLYELFGKNGILLQKQFELSNKNVDLQFPYLATYGNSVQLKITFVKDEQLFTNVQLITKKQPSKKLDIQFDSFRDKLLPNTQEEWNICVKDEQHMGQSAEILTTMYDASLDEMAHHEWNFTPGFTPYINYPFWQTSYANCNQDYLYLPMEMAEEKEINYPKINWFGFNYPMQYGFVKGGYGKALRMESSVMAKGESNKAIDVVSMEDVSTANPAEKVQVQQQPTSVVRENFSETAFFYPFLTTDTTGHVSFHFTVPESLTKWKILTLAHTKDAKYGQRTDVAYTQKVVSVTPNLPRFITKGDKANLTAKITNMSDSIVLVNARWIITDAQTNKEITNQIIQNITVKPNSSVPVSCVFEMNSSSSLLQCKIIVEGKGYSDGEQHYLPVLSNRMLVTESLPMSIYEEGNHQFTFDNLLHNTSKTLENNRFVVEFSANTAWYALQALPSLTITEESNAISYMSSFYANVIGQQILKSSPKLVQLIERSKINQSNYLSNLQKNEDLKNILLEETPWVLEAKNETEQQQRLASLLDANNQAYNRDFSFQKLKQLQMPSGGFAWFSGMPENAFVTRFILEKMGKLAKLNNFEYEQKELDMQAKAINYLDSYVQKEYIEWSKRKDKTEENYLNMNIIHSLYVRSFYPQIPLKEESKEAYRYYTNLMEKQWNKQSLYGKSLIAVALYRNKKGETANNIVKSLKEQSSLSSEIGMYWDKNVSGYTWCEANITTQVAIMEAFNEINSQKDDIEKMKIWLLKNKQTNQWSNVISTVDAISALAFQGKNVLENESQITIKLNNQEMKQQDSPLAGSNYVKIRYDGTDVTPEMGNISVSKTGNGLSWGAAYWQYFEQTDRLNTQQKGPLNIDKKLFVEKITDKNVILKPVENVSLQVGDKLVVRLTVRVDRDMNFVHIKDLRAACFEPVNQKSSYQQTERVGYYLNPKDVSMNYFFNRLPKGTYVFEYPLWTNLSGEFTTGIATVQCLYAPEFMSRTQAQKINVISSK